MIKGLNHITLAVKDLDRSLEFYQNVLGLELRKTFGNGAYLEAGLFWVCLSVDEETRTQPHQDYTHVAFDIDEQNFDALKEKLITGGARQWKDNKSEGASFYFLDPDGHKLEIHVGTLQSRLEYMEKKAA